MTIFDYVTATILIVLGLGVTELLNDAIGLFRDRKSRPPDWISLAWAGIVFSFQMQFIWAVFELDSLMETWTAFKFILTLMLALLLFAAGALIIPRPTPDGHWDPWQRFLDNGRWSLIALACYSFIGFIANALLFGIDLFERVNLNNLVLAVLLIAVFFLRSRKHWAWATLIVAVYSGYEIVKLSPMAYS